ncbi:outer membrane autotransporter protein [Ereboglobus sp. PH5-10]|uniref:autotransporter outer membrane beta-barrel domain-containing protein n=1 Tax=Ereboglobus sp. PH5-10 TaxID=2940629 RepID=UPI0024062AD7|nr:autotransporter outer membrane beta-barrel domain-containing protein [Ereboglobus sp. PH5-10]MDF9827800.1 outer membrane autotransporter protein [Ereboglobus sp. PH5-10]
MLALVLGSTVEMLGANIYSSIFDTDPYATHQGTQSLNITTQGNYSTAYNATPTATIYTGTNASGDYFYNRYYAYNKDMNAVLNGVAGTGGVVSITHDNTGALAADGNLNVTTSGNNSNYALDLTNQSLDGTTTVTLNNASFVGTTSGVRLITPSTGASSIALGSNVTVNATTALYFSSLSGATTINNAGTITGADSAIQNANGGTAAVRLVNTGNLISQGLSGLSSAVELYSDSGDITVEHNAGTIVAQNQASTGHAIDLASTSGNLAVTTAAGATVTAAGSGRGIDATSSTGDIAIAAGGAVTVQNGDGIYASSAGDIDITTTGNVIATGNGRGIVAAGTGTEDINITASGGVIRTANNSGIVATNNAAGAGDITIDTTGATLDINVSGSQGIQATLGSVSATGDISVTTGTGTIRLGVNGDDGIQALNYGSGKVTVDNSANIYNQGQLAHHYGIVAISGYSSTTDGGAVSVTNSGRIETNAGPSILASARNNADGDAVTVVNNGVLKSENHSGIVATNAGGAGAVNVTNSSTIDAYSHGIEAVVATGTATITNTGLITTENGSGVRVSAGSGLAVVRNQNGILAQGIGMHGVEINGSGTVTNTGVIESENVNGDGVRITGTGYVDNQLNAVIKSGGGNGIHVGSGTVSNSGRVDAADGTGVLIDNAGLVVNTGSVNAASGVFVGGVARVDNSGRIKATEGHGVRVNSGLVQNLGATGSIEADGANHHGVFIDTTGTLINQGLVQASGANGHGVNIGGDGAVGNTGAITAINGHGVTIGGDGLVENTGAGSIQAGGADHHGVFIAGSGTVINEGSIKATGANGDGINIGPGLVQNENLIEANHSGIVINGSGTALNTVTGNIFAGNGNGIQINDAGADLNRVENAGNISLGVNTGARGIEVTSQGGNIDIINTGKVANLHGTGGAGIYATTTATGEINITQTGAGAEIRTGHATGIFAEAEDGAINVVLDEGILRATDAAGIVARTQDGDILVDTTGATVQISAIAANEHGIEGSSSGAGSVQIVTGDPATVISTIGTGANGIRATSDTGAAVTVDMQGGSITTAGPDATGIYAALTGAAATGDVGVRLAGSITTTGNVSHGISATNAGSGDSIVELADTAAITTSNGSAVHATTVDGDIFVTGTKATINAVTRDDALNALNTVSTGAGNIEVLAAGNYTTHGDGAHGWNLQTDGGNILAIHNNGALTTSGELSHAVNAETTGAGTVTIGLSDDTVISTVDGSAVNALSEDGDIIISATGATIDANTVTDGIAALNAVATGAGDIQVAAQGNYTTTGDGSHGWNLQSDGGNITAIHNNGAIKTSGEVSHAVNAETTGAGSVTIGLSDDSVISTVDGSAVNALSADGDIIISATGATITANTVTDGLAALNAVATGTGNVYVKTQGDYTTAGDGAHGWNLQSNGGAIEAIHGGGAITTTGEISHAINAETSGAGSVVVSISDDTVISTADGSAVNALSGDGDITIVSGTATSITANTVTDGIHGLSAVATGTGSILVATQGDYTTAGDGAHGWNLASNGGNILALHSNGAITTTGEISHAINAETSGTGAVVVSISDDTVISTADGSAVNAVSEDGDITIVSGTATSITANTVTDGIHGLSAVATGTGSILVATQGDYTTAGDGAHGWNLESNGGNIVAYYGGGALTTTGEVSHAINATTSGNGGAGIYLSDDTVISTADGSAVNAVSGNGDIIISATAASIVANTVTDGIHGLSAVATGTGSILVATQGDYTTAGDNAHGWNLQTDGGAITANYLDGAISTNGDNSHGIYAETNSVADGDITIRHGGAISTNGDNSHGIFADAYAGSSVDIGLIDGSSITTADGSAIVAYTDDGDILIRGDDVTINANTITDNVHGLDATSYEAGNVSVITRGSYTTAGDGAHGWNLETDGGNVYAEMLSGTITTAGADAIGINAMNHSGTGDVTVVSNAIINTTGAGAHGIVAESADGVSTIISKGAVTTTGDYANALMAACRIAVVQLEANADASGFNASAIVVEPSFSSTVNILAGISAHGGWGAGAAGIILDDTGSVTGGHTVTNAGYIGASSDNAITILGNSDVTVVNTGTIVGTITGGTGHHTIVNTGEWHHRSHADTTGASGRDTLGVAVSHLGDGINTIINTGTMHVVGADESDVVTVDDTGSYHPFLHTQHALAASGAAHAHVLRVASFHNQGVLNLANGITGDILLLSESAIAGDAGSGVYISDNGRLTIDFVYNEGGANSLSDILVVDSTQVAGGATIITANPVGGPGALTTGNGIPVVEVLGGMGVSARDAFALDSRHFIGPFEYRLYHGAKGGNPANDGNWYLRSHYRPSVSGHLANWYEGAVMFNHTHHERVSNDLSAASATDASASGNDKKNNGWLRISGRMNLGDSAAKTHRVNTTNYVVHAGYDMLATEGAILAGDLIRVGVMGGYGNSQTDIKVDDISIKGSSRIDGFNIGVYGSWFADKAGKRGWYADAWLSFATYDNQVDDDGMRRLKYDSHGMSLSVEGGYAWYPKKTGMVFEPQAQLIYNRHSTDTHTDEVGMTVRSRSSEYMRSRLGLRVYPQRRHFFQPFVEASWWHAYQYAELRFDSHRVKYSVPRDMFGFKFGAQADLGRGWTIWGDAGAHIGTNYNYMDVRAMFGIRYGW